MTVLFTLLQINVLMMKGHFIVLNKKYIKYINRTAQFSTHDYSENSFDFVNVALKTNIVSAT